MVPQSPPWLTKDEIDDLCQPLTQAAAQIRFLRSLGLTVKTKPNGTPLVIRSHFEQVMNPAGKRSQRHGHSRTALAIWRISPGREVTIWLPTPSIRGYRSSCYRASRSSSWCWPMLGEQRPRLWRHLANLRTPAETQRGHQDRTTARL
ncbi:MAG: DUF4224 domain-containing protein [Sulfuritalea sp.]|nr:DUF4224 domain-containing protein [Sulfuritalea sp.]